MDSCLERRNERRAPEQARVHDGDSGGAPSRRWGYGGHTRPHHHARGAAAALRALQRTASSRTAGWKQSVSRWPYNAIPLPDFCKAIADMGLTAIDLLEEPDWAVARDHGLTDVDGLCRAAGRSSDGLNVTANHDAIVTQLRAADSEGGLDEAYPT